MYKIIDWAGNHLFRNNTFKTFQDGWDFIYIKFPKNCYCDTCQDCKDAEDLGDYYVVKI